MMNSVNAVAINMPAKMTMPMLSRLFAPAPEAITNGNAPAAVASDVMTMGRRRILAASMIASSKLRPSSRNWLVNSTIRMPFFAARPTSMTMPIWL